MTNEKTNRYTESNNSENLKKSQVSLIPHNIKASTYSRRYEIIYAVLSKDRRNDKK